MWPLSLALSVAGPASLLLPSSPPLQPFAPRAPAVARRAFVACCDSEAEEINIARIGGMPVEEGESILCRDEASDAWWRASVRQIRGSQVLVHFSGCDDAWDQVRMPHKPRLSTHASPPMPRPHVVDRCAARSGWKPTRRT